MRFSTVVLATLLLSSLQSCGVRPDEKSGGDEHRHIAKQIPLNQWIPDDVSGSEGDKTDWKVFELTDSGFLFVEVAIDNEKANIGIELYDRYGKLVTKRIRRSGDEINVNLSAEVSTGKYFIKIYALKGGDKTGYSLRARLK